MQLISPNTNIDFVRKTRFFAIVSILAVVASIFLIATRGFNLGIEFVGGTTIQIKLPEALASANEGTLRGAMAALGYGSAEIVRFGALEEQEFQIRIRESQENNKDLSVEILNGLAENLGVDALQAQKVESIGPRVGKELQRDGLAAVGWACLAILLYVWIRFDRRYAPGAVAALLHDVTITAGIFSLLQIEFNMQALAALLVVIGYSLNDTIVIYDRIRENVELRGKVQLADVVNQSINQTLSRTLLTSITTLLVVFALLFLGGPVIRNFSLALSIGVVIGTYSTIFVASALLISLERYFAERDAAAAG